VNSGKFLTVSDSSGYQTFTNASKTNQNCMIIDKVIHPLYTTLNISSLLRKKDSRVLKPPVTQITSPARMITPDIPHTITCISLPTFNGKWLSLRDTYETSIIDSHQLPYVQKFHYLGCPLCRSSCSSSKLACYQRKFQSDTEFHHDV